MTDEQALEALGALLSHALPGYYAIGLNDEPSRWMLSTKARWVMPTLTDLLWAAQPTINAVPLRDIDVYGWHRRSSLLWAVTSSGTSAERLRRFKPKPAVVLRQGQTVHYTAFWALSHTLDMDWLERANKRLAHFFGSPKLHAPDTFRFALPGSILREGRKNPQPVQMVRYVPEVVTARQVVGRLRDAPPPWTPETAGDFRARSAAR